MLTFFLSFFPIIINQIFLLISYVSNTHSFPQPLSSQEEELYLKNFQDGDVEAKNILIERNLRLVAHIIKKYSTTGKDTDDLISIGTIGLIKAISTFDMRKGTRLATYAARCIENEILMTIRADKKCQNEVSLNEPIGIDKEGNEISLIDIMSNDHESVLEEVALKMQIKNLYCKMKDVLKNREKLVLQLRYGLLNGHIKTQREIAEQLGISRSYVSRIEKKAVKKLCKELKVEDGM